MHLALAIRNRGYTNKVRLRGLMQNQGFQPAQAGFACVAATSSRLVQDISQQLLKFETYQTDVLTNVVAMDRTVILKTA
ncbi:MAG: hypothetical protein ICV54_16960 [Nostoc sp. C3-bin3]|nr:hypothetical protein [Nostoc sp. C3-bin3]